MKHPSTKHQAPEKFQSPNFKARSDGCLEFEVWCFSGAWSLVLGAFFILSFQMLAKFRRCHARVVAEKVAEIKFAGEIELAGNVLDGQPLVGQQQPRLVQPGALDVLMNGALARRVKQRAQ